MNVEDQLRQTLHDWAAEAPLHAARPVPGAMPATGPRSTARGPLALAAGLLVALGVVATVWSAKDDDPYAQVQTTEPPQVLGEWDRQQYRQAFGAIRTAPTVRLDLEDIAEGVTQTEIEGMVMYTVRRGDDVRVILPTSPYEGARVPFCQRSGWFESTTHGEMWDETGEPANDLAQRGLPTIPVYVEGDEVAIDLAGLTPGAPAEHPRTPRPAVGPHCVGSGGPDGLDQESG